MSDENLSKKQLIKCYIKFLKGILYKEIGSKTVVLAVYDFDRFGKHDMIGTVEVPLNSIDLGQMYDATKEIEPADKVFMGFL